MYDILSGIYFDILSGICFLAFYVVSIPIFYLAFFLACVPTFCLACVRVRVPSLICLPGLIWTIGFRSARAQAELC